MTTTVAMNLAGTIETPGMENSPYLTDVDGLPYVPVGDGGVVLGLSVGDGVFDFDAEHASPGVSLVHADPAARHALTAFACMGNRVTVRSGAATGAIGTVFGKRGEEGRVLVVFESDVLATLVPGDAMAVRASGQGSELPAGLGGAVMNVDPAFLSELPVGIEQNEIEVAVRGVVGSKLIGNGIGRPAQQWNLDLQVDAATAPAWRLEHLSIGDLIAVQDLDVRHNAGYRAGWSTVGVVLTTTSPRPGHGPAVMPILCLPSERLTCRIQSADHVGVTATMLGVTA